MNNDYINEDDKMLSYFPNQEQIQQAHVKNKFSFFDLKDQVQNQNQMQKQSQPQDRETEINGNYPSGEDAELDYDQLASKKLFNKTGDIHMIRRQSEKLQNEEIEDLCEEPRALSPCKSTNDVLEKNCRASETSSQNARNLRDMEKANENLRVQKPDDDEDEPSLQSPDPRLRETGFEEAQSTSRNQNDNFNASDSVDRTQISHVIRGLKHQEACRPASFLSQVRPKSGGSGDATPTRNFDTRVKEDSHLTESPELRHNRAANSGKDGFYQNRQNNQSDDEEEEPVDQMFLPQKAQNDYQDNFQSKQRSFQHKSEQKAFRTQKMTENAYNYEEDIGSGLIAPDSQNNFVDTKTPIKKPSNKNDYRGKSANQAQNNGCIPSAELQAHMEQMRLRQQQTLSPFPGTYQRNGHMDSLQSMQYQQQLSPFYVNPLLNSVRKSQNGLHMTPGTPSSLYQAETFNQYNGINQYAPADSMTQSMHLHAMQYNLAHQMQGHNLQDRDSMGLSQQANQLHTPMHPLLHGQPAPGQQYEVLLKEKMELQTQLDFSKHTIEEQRRQTTQLSSEVVSIKFSLTQKEEDLDEAVQQLDQKEQMIKDVKDTLRRQNQQIEQQREDSSQSREKERFTHTQNETLKRENKELKQKIETIQKELSKIQEQVNKGKQQMESGPKQKLSKEQDEQLQQKNKEIYALTVELGCISEENNELKSNLQAQKTDFQERISEQRKRLDEEFSKLQEEFEYYKIESQEAYKDAQATIVESSEKLEASKKELENQQNEFERFEEQQQQKEEELKSQTVDIDQKLQNKTNELLVLSETCELLQLEMSQLTANNQLLKNQVEQVKDELENEKLSHNIVKVSRESQTTNLKVNNADNISQINQLEGNDDEINSDLQHRARLLESPSSQKVLSYQAPRERNYEDIQEKQSVLPQTIQPLKLRSNVEQLKQQQKNKGGRAVNHQQAHSVGTDEKINNQIIEEQTEFGQNVWKASHFQAVVQDAVSGAGGETAQYNPVDTPLGSRGNKYIRSGRDGQAYDEDGLQRFDDMDLNHPYEKCSSQDGTQLTPLGRAEKEMEALDCTQPFAAEHVPIRMDQTTRHVELNEELWETELAGMHQQSINRQEPQEQQAESLFGRSSAAERASWIHGPKSKVRELSTGIIGDGTTKIGTGLRAKAAADRGGGRNTARPQYTGQTKKSVDHNITPKPSQRNQQQASNKAGYSVPDRTNMKQPTPGSWAAQSPGFNQAFSSRGDVSQSQNNLNYGKGYKLRSEATAINTPGVDRPLASARTSLAPAQSSSDLLSSTLRTSTKNTKKSQNPSSGRQTHTRSSLAGGGPTGPLGVGSRLIAQRKKQQSTAGQLVADLAPKRPTKLNQNTTPGTKGYNSKSGVNQQLGSTQQNVLNSFESGQRNSVAQNSGYWTKTSGRLAQAGPGGGHTIASRAKAEPSTPGLFNRDLAQSQFGSTTNFSQNFQTARQFLSRSPKPTELRSSANFGAMAGRESMQSRDQLLERARQQTQNQEMASAFGTSKSGAGEAYDVSDRGDPFADASNRAPQEAEIISQNYGPSAPVRRAYRGGKVNSSAEGPLRVMSKSLISSNQNPRTFKNLKENENSPTIGGNDERDEENGVERMTSTNGAANPGCLTSRTGTDQVEDTETKENMTDMRQKLQSIQTGKAYLEKKIQEYEARLNQMKTKKDKSDKTRAGATTTAQSQVGLVVADQGAGMHTSRPQMRGSASRL